ncbi:MAG: hypothetical protein JWM21_990 [Acidobacteria bacterium]|nr:hypothetical protein [Acidobacteriota bacterium]
MPARDLQAGRLPYKSITRPAGLYACVNVAVNTNGFKANSLGPPVAEKFRFYTLAKRPFCLALAGREHYHGQRRRGWAVDTSA